AGRGRAHGQGIRPRGRELHPLRRERGGAHQQPGQPARDAHLRPGGARTARPQLHEDHLARPGGAVMAAAATTRGTKVPEIRKGDTVVVLAGKDAGKTGKVERVIRREAAPKGRSMYRRGSGAAGVSVVVEGLNIAKRHTKPRQTSSATD